MTTQQDLFAQVPNSLPNGVTEADQANLRGHLMSHGWQTRKELCQALGWDDRKVRDVAETLGTEIVRCQMGFKLLDQCNREDLAAVKQCIDAFESQAKKMAEYASGLRRRLHALVG